MSTSLKSLINIIDNANSHVQASLNLSDEMIEKMYQLGVYHGFFQMKIMDFMIEKIQYIV